MKLLLDQGGSEVQISEDVVTAAAGNEWDGEFLIKLLLDERPSEVQITEAVVMAAARNTGGKSIIKLLLERRGSEVLITDGVINAAVQRSMYGRSEFTEFLRSERASRNRSELVATKDEATLQNSKSY